MDSRLVLGVMFACVTACDARLGDSSDAVRPDGNAGGGDGSGAGNADAAMLGAWGPPQLIQGASNPAINEDDCTLNSTQTELYFAVPDAALMGSPKQLWLMTRATKNDPWGTPAPVPALNNSVTNEAPRLSPDDLTIYFGRNGNIFTATRTTVGQPWSPPAAVATVNNGNYAKWMAVCDGGYFMVSRDTAADNQDLFQGAEGTSGIAVAELNSPDSEISTFLSNDCLTVFFASDRSGNTQMYTATRASLGDTWSAPTLVTDFGAASDNEDPWMSTDQRAFVFASIRAPLTTKDLYLSTR